MHTVIVVGGGASGMLAAYAAATNERDNRVILIEKNEKLGKKVCGRSAGQRSDCNGAYNKNREGRRRSQRQSSLHDLARR